MKRSVRGKPWTTCCLCAGALRCQANIDRLCLIAGWMETLTSYSTKKQRGKVISSKVQPLHGKPRRPRFQTVSRTGHKTGKGVVTEIKLAIEPRKKTVHFQERSSKVQPLLRPKRTVSRTGHTTSKGVVTDIKLTTEPGKKTVRFQERIPDYEKSGKHWKLSIGTGQLSSEKVTPRRSQSQVAQDSATLILNADRRPSQATESRVPRQRSGLHRRQCSREPSTRSRTRFPVKNEHISPGGGAARSPNAPCIRNNEPRNIVPVAFRARPTRERPVTSAAPVPRR